MVPPRPVLLFRGFISFRVATSHNLTVASQPPDRIVFPSGENVTWKTNPLCPASEAFSLPVLRSQTLTIPASLGVAYSPLHEARVRPSGEKAAVQTRSVWPSSRVSSLPDFAS